MSEPLFQFLFPDKPLTGHVPLSGEDLKVSGMESVLSHTPEAYKERFVNAIKSFPRGRAFTVEDVRSLIGDLPSEVHYNAIGSLVRFAAMRGLMRKTGTTVKAKKASLHSRELAVWVRL